MDPRRPRTKNDPTFERLNQSIRVPSAVRIALALLILVGGAILVISGVFLLITNPQRAVTHPTAAFVVTILVIVLGSAFVYVGAQLLRARPQTRSGVLFGPRARTIIGLFFAVAAIGMAIAAWQSDGALPALQALGVGFLSFLIFRSAASPER